MIGFGTAAAGDAPRGKTMTMKANAKPCSEARLAILGKPSVGKSALLVRYLTRRFIWEYDPTLECTYRHQAMIDEDTITLDILDTAGQELNGHLEGNVRWGDGFMIVYSICDRQSFLHVSHIKRYLDEIKKSRNVSFVIVGNKSDLEHARQVTTSEGERLAVELGCAYFETSAYDGGGDIDVAFQELFREVKRRKTLELRPRRKSSTSQMKQVFNKVFTKIQTGTS